MDVGREEQHVIAAITGYARHLPAENAERHQGYDYKWK